MIDETQVEPTRQRSPCDGCARPVYVAGAAKVHLGVQFTRYRADNSTIGRYRLLYIVTKRDGVWAIAARSSFAG